MPWLLIVWLDRSSLVLVLVLVLVSVGWCLAAGRWLIGGARIDGSVHRARGAR